MAERPKKKGKKMNEKEYEAPITHKEFLALVQGLRKEFADDFCEFTNGLDRDLLNKIPTTFEEDFRRSVMGEVMLQFFACYISKLFFNLDDNFDDYEGHEEMLNDYKKYIMDQYRLLKEVAKDFNEEGKK